MSARTLWLRVTECLAMGGIKNKKTYCLTEQEVCRQTGCVFGSDILVVLPPCFIVLKAMLGSARCLPQIWTIQRQKGVSFQRVERPFLEPPHSPPHTSHWPEYAQPGMPNPWRKRERIGYQGQSGPCW